jgi:hypothetical protein
MAVFRYNKTVNISKDDDVYLNIVHPSKGTASYTLVDIPGDGDMETTNEAKLYLGKGKDLLVERTVVYSKVVNMDENNLEVKINFLINNNDIETHTNPKSIDPSPQIKMNIIFNEI